MHSIDISENELLYWAHGLLRTLLYDRTTNQNIFWATNDYCELGAGYGYADQISIERITGVNNGIIRPRVAKTMLVKKDRAKKMAEVFTPSWLCNLMNNAVDASLFGRNAVFNDATDTANTKDWHSTEGNIVFPDNLLWQDYVEKNVIEITCGEAPFLVSRYDTVSGKIIKNLAHRVGLLDRKLRIVNENCQFIEDWKFWTKIAFQSTYGYEWQGDNLLLARENLLLTLFDYYSYRWGEQPPMEYVCDIAEIISWNIWQMDGLKFVIPNSCKTRIIEETDLSDNVTTTVIPCPGCKRGNLHKHNGVYCLIKDWKKDKIVRADTLVR